MIGIKKNVKQSKILVRDNVPNELVSSILHKYTYLQNFGLFFVTVKINLEHGSILFMNPPTNEIWYHSLPTRKKLQGVRINLTFRKMRMK